MAGEYDEKFEEITGLLKKTVGGLNELRMEVRNIRSELRDNTSNLLTLTDKVTGLSCQFNDVGVMAIDDHKRIDSLEERVDVLEGEVH